MSPKAPPWILAALVSLTTLPGQLLAAGSADFTKQLVAEADRQQLDLKTNLVQFIGNVIVTQGSIRIDADQLDVIRTPDGSGIREIIAVGRPARYQQTLEDGTPVKAEANELRYKPQQRVLLATGNAQLSQEQNLIRGKLIRYDLAKEQLFAEGAETGEGQQERVTTIFLPEKDKKP